MIEFKPEENSAAAARQFGEGAVLYSAVPGNEQIAFRADENGCLILGFTGSGENGTVIEGLIRSALNFLANRGAYTARVTASDLPEKVLSVFLSLGFEKENGVLTADIPDVLTSCRCSGKN